MFYKRASVPTTPDLTGLLRRYRKPAKRAGFQQRLRGLALRADAFRSDGLSADRRHRRLRAIENPQRTRVSNSPLGRPREKLPRVTHIGRGGKEQPQEAAAGWRLPPPSLTLLAAGRAAGAARPTPPRCAGAAQPREREAGVRTRQARTCAGRSAEPSPPGSRGRWGLGGLGPHRRAQGGGVGRQPVPVQARRSGGPGALPWHVTFARMSNVLDFCQNPLCSLEE